VLSKASWPNLKLLDLSKNALMIGINNITNRGSKYLSKGNWPKQLKI
jgi:hypothetical protein